MQQNWHNGYLLPVSWALLIHLVFFALLLRPLPVSPPVVEPVSSYLYTPPKRVVPTEPLLTEVAEAVLSSELDDTKVAIQAEPNTSSAIVKEMLSNATAITEQYEVLGDLITTEHASVDTDARLVTEHASKSAISSSSLAERVLLGITQQYSTPVADYAGWALRQQQPRLTVAKDHQQRSANPAAGVLFTYTDGKQLVRLNSSCMIVDPALDFFEQQMKAKGIPCKESDDAILFRQTMSKWLDR